MKVRDSGMPDESWWNSFFEVETILDKLQLGKRSKDVVEIGCGYGTFTIPVAKRISGTLYGFDIEQEMLDTVSAKIKQEGLENIRLECRDILTKTTGLAEHSIDYFLLFNILHHETPQEFLNEAIRVLKPGGKVGIIHWRSDIPTPRGPDLSIRPKPEQVRDWMDPKVFALEIGPLILEPFHYGMVFTKKHVK
jgi:ubiquinone/menaquinone biosynthesis C-methylase UbiE